MPFVLHHDLVGSGDPAAWMFVLHGIFGSGQNWRSFARKLTSARPDWGAVLVDLRQHGRSQDAPPPHTLDAAAADLAELADVLSRGGKHVRGICGHSFGGKVALRYRGSAGPELLTTWILDASPSDRPGAMQEDGTVVKVLRTLEELPAAWESRDDFVVEVKRRGYPEGLARWLAMNLEPRAGGGFESRLELPAIRSLLGDYYARSLWEAVEDEDAPGDLHVVAAGRGSALDEADLERLRRLERERGRAHLHTFPRAGHWLHIDALADLVTLVGDRLPLPSS